MRPQSLRSPRGRRGRGGGEPDTDGHRDARDDQLDRDGISRDERGGDHPEERLGQEPGGQRARPLVAQQPEVHDEVEPGHRDALVGIDEVRVDLESLLVLRDRVVEPAHLQEKLRVRVVGVRIVGDELDVLLERLLGVREVPVLAVRVAEQVPGGRVARVDLRRLAVVLDRLREILLAEPVARQGKLRPLVARVRGDGVVEVMILLGDVVVRAGLRGEDQELLGNRGWQRIVGGSMDHYNYEIRMIRKDRTIIWTDVRGHAVRDTTGRLTHLFGATVDITDRKRVEESLRQREQELQTVLRERERISEDLHDGILQSLYAVGLGLESSKPLMRQRKHGQATVLVEHAIRQLNHVMAELRNFIAGLESDVLQGGDFAAALQTMVQTLSASAATACRVSIEEAAARQLSTEQALHLMNVVREALSNSLRHSRAKRITVSLKPLAEAIRLTVTDNGVGFKPAAAQGVGHGLANMVARAQKIGGRFVVRSRPRKGTKILLDLPRCR